MKTIRQALELEMIAEEKADDVYYFSIWAGSLDFLRFAVSRFLRGDSDSASPFDDPGAFPQHEKKLQDIVDEGLIEAIRLNQVELLKLLLQHRLVKKEYSKSAAEHGFIFEEIAFLRTESRLAMLELVLSSGFDVNYAYGAGVDKTPLMYFIESDRRCISSVYILLEHGADPFAVDEHGRTALHYAAACDFPSAATALEIHLPMETPLKDYLELKDFYGKTPLMHAVYSASLNMVESLLNDGARLLNRCPKGESAFDCIFEWSTGWFPPTETQLQKQFEVARLLFERLAELKRKQAFLPSKPTDTQDDDRDWCDVKELFRRIRSRRDHGDIWRMLEEFEEFEEEREAVLAGNKKTA
ncbi:hypothetical protein HDU96_003372 [Phlyctochytrium bullatum]|nr:hypothetical protein HDU96_003372 [Phlyctochytrium bullatum]